MSEQKICRSPSFKEYVDFLKENFENLLEYRKLTGTTNLKLTKTKEDLFNVDPFVAYNGIFEATQELANKDLYH